jgi:hypothetical protein
VTIFLKRFSLGRTAFWTLLLIPSYFFGWIYSVAFVSLCSLYANAASDFASYRADDNKEVLERLDRIEEMLTKLIKDESHDPE